VLAIDPGSHSGLALFERGVLVLAEWSLEPHEVARKLDALVIEIPQHYPQNPVPPQNLITLAVNAGQWIQANPAAKVVRIFPRQWKAQAQKTATRHRLGRILKDGEKRAVGFDSLKHDTVDAIGIGCWYLGRR
jgi:hypothetical protein